MLHSIFLKIIISEGVISNFTIIHWLKASGTRCLLKLPQHVKLHLQVTVGILLYNRCSKHKQRRPIQNNFLLMQCKNVEYKNGCNVKMLRCSEICSTKTPFLFVKLRSQISDLHWQCKWPLDGAVYISVKPAGAPVIGCLWFVPLTSHDRNRKLLTSENNKDGGDRKQQLLGRHGSEMFSYLHLRGLR